MKISLSRLMLTYGLILLIGALSAFIIIGMKTKNLMISCLIFSLTSILISRLAQKNTQSIHRLSAILVALAALVVFAFRASVNLLALIGIVQHELDQYDAYNKCINLIILIFLAAASISTFLIACSAEKTESSTN